MGGSPNQDSGDAYREAFVYDLNNGESVGVERVGDLIHPRVFGSALALPDGKVFVAGGQTRARKFSDAGGVLQPEMYDPDTKQFTPLAPMKTPRVYHSACIMLKDARVACMGGGLYVKHSWSAVLDFIHLLTISIPTDALIGLHFHATITLITRSIRRRIC